MKVSNPKFGFLLSIPGLAIVAGLMFYPISYTVYLSFFRYNNITPPLFNGLENYRWLFSSSDFYRSWTVSTIYSMGTGALTLFIALISAHSLYKITKGRTFFRTVVIIPWAIPLVIAGLMFEWMFNEEIGVINHVLMSSGLVGDKIEFFSNPTFAMMTGIFAGSICYVPFTTVVILAGLMGIPADIYEAAEVDGASVLQKFWHISVPLNKHQILIAFLIVLMFTFRTPDIFVSLTAGGPAKYTYHAGMFLMDTIYKYLTFGHAGAISVMLFITIAGFAFPMLYYGIIRGSKL